MPSVLNTDSNITGDTILTAENTQTITGLNTFDRDPNAPFAVSAGSAVVSNLDADKLDGQEGSYYTNATNLASGTIPSARTLQGQYHVVAYNNGTQSIPNNTSTAVTFDSEDLDTATFHSTSANTSRITIPASQGGLYLCIGRLAFAGAAGGYRQAILKVNGATDHQLVTVAPADSSAVTVIVVTQAINLAAGDYVELYAFHTQGGALNVGHAATRSVQSELRVVRLT